MNEVIISFQEMNIPAPILQALEEKGYGWPTKVQAEAICRSAMSFEAC